MRGLILGAMLAALCVPMASAQDDPYADFEIGTDISALPEAVQQTRAALIEATQSGDINALKAIMDAQKAPPRISFGEPDDAIAYLKTESADGNGVEILAILRNMLEAPYAVFGASQGNPSYVWPYLAIADVTKLTPAQQVDAYRVMPAEQALGLAEMEAYYYWRVFIDEDGQWSAFVAGD